MNYIKVLYGAGLKSNLMIFDVGAHKGQTSSHICKLFPQSFIHAFEPSPTYLMKSRKTYQKEKTLDAITLPLGKPMKRHFSPDPSPTYVVKLSKPKRIIQQV